MAAAGDAFGPRGDPARHLAFGDLERMLAAMPLAPRNAGRVTLVVRRGPGKVREAPARVALGVATGIPGDAWRRREDADPEGELTVMEAAVATLIANGQPLTLFGDNLFLALDLSAGNLPPGSRLRVGGAVLEVTPKPHDGCRKFAARFGQDALRFVAKRELRHRNLRGIYMRVVEAGEIALGDAVEVLSRPSAVVR
jgi:MOSC domain-containing protein